MKRIKKTASTLTSCEKEVIFANAIEHIMRGDTSYSCIALNMATRDYAIDHSYPPSDYDVRDVFPMYTSDLLTDYNKDCDKNLILVSTNVWFRTSYDRIAFMKWCRDVRIWNRKAVNQ